MAMPLDVRITLQDAKGNTATTTTHLPDNTPIASAEAFAPALADAISDLSGCKIVDISISISVPYDDINHPTPAVNSDTEEGALFSFRDLDGRVYTQRIPGFAETFISPGSRAVDLTNATVAAYVNLIIDGLASPAVDPVSLANVDITTISSAQEQFVKNRRGRRL